VCRAMLRVSDSRPEFVDTSPGGWFTGKDPTVEPSLLRQRWIAAAPVIHIERVVHMSSVVDLGGCHDPGPDSEKVVVAVRMSWFSEPLQPVFISTRR
jgi:hypothetical protein